MPRSEASRSFRSLVKWKLLALLLPRPSAQRLRRCAVGLKLLQGTTGDLPYSAREWQVTELAISPLRILRRLYGSNDLLIFC